VADEVGTAAQNGAEGGGEGGGGGGLHSHGPTALIVLGAARAPNCKASPTAACHCLCSKLTDAAPSATRETHKEPS